MPVTQPVSPARRPLAQSRALANESGQQAPQWPLYAGALLGLTVLSHNVDYGALWNGYLSALEQNPFPTKVATGVFGAWLGDCLAQALPHLKTLLKGKKSPQPFRYDFVRAARFMVYSAVVATPIAAMWYSVLDQVVGVHNPTAPTTIATKVALDQLLMTPFMTCLFFASMSTLEGKANQAWGMVTSKLIPTLKANYALWPLAHVINFAFVPGDLRILYVNVVALVWAVFLSSMAAGGPEQPQGQQQPARATGQQHRDFGPGGGADAVVYNEKAMGPEA